jgi:hypothetical protein
LNILLLVEVAVVQEDTMLEQEALVDLEQALVFP